MSSSLAINQPKPAAIARPSDAILDRLWRLHPKLIDLSLERMERLLLRLGHPERRLPPVVHVAGTNGKGSVIAYLRAMLEAAGRQVHVYSSPHLVRFHERIRLDGRLIEEPALAALLEECEAANGIQAITYFEVTTAAAFLAFSRQAADVLLLETGLGGRLDATNMVARPRLCVITPISIDHVQFLGDSLAEIAFEKAGILKPGVAAVIAPQPQEALQVIEERAARIDAPLVREGRDWGFCAEGSGLRFSASAGSMALPKPVLAGAHQIVNAACAVAAARELADLGLGPEAIGRGLLEAQWPGRLQRLRQGELVALLPAGWQLWLDGGHNQAAGEALGTALNDWGGSRPVHLIVGMMNSKAIHDFLRPLIRQTKSLQTIAIPGEPNSLSAECAAQAAQEMGATATPWPDAASAVRHIVRQGPAGRILICGSLYLAGTVLAGNA